MRDSELDSWDLPGVAAPWVVRVTVYTDDISGHPRNTKDVYDPDKVEEELREEARQTLRDWENGRWEFVRVRVVPVLTSGTVEIPFESAAHELYSVEWGEMSNGDAPPYRFGREQINEYPGRELAETALAEAERLRSLVVAAR